MGVCVPLSIPKVLMVVLHSVMAAAGVVTVVMMTVNHALSALLGPSLALQAQTVQPHFSTDGHTLFLSIGLLVPVITGMVATFYPHPRSRIVHGVFLGVALLTDVVLFGLEVASLHLMYQCPCSLQDDGCVCGCQAPSPSPPPWVNGTRLGYAFVEVELCFAARTRVVYVVFLTLGWLAGLGSLLLLVVPLVKARLASSKVLQRLQKREVQPNDAPVRDVSMTPSVPPVSHTSP